MEDTTITNEMKRQAALESSKANHRTWMCRAPQGILSDESNSPSNGGCE